MITKNTIARRNGAYGAYEAYWAHGTNGAYGLLRLLVTLSFIIFNISFSVAQIRIGGNVYGGGNQGNVEGSTKVTVRAGDIGAVLDPDAERPLKNPRGKVFGGARMANVGGNTFVHIDGENASDYIVANYVYGGNDIAGTIGTAKAVDEAVPAELTAVKRLPADDDDTQKNDIDDTWNSYVRISTKTDASGNEVSSAKKIYIGQLFAGSNGDFDYEDMLNHPTSGRTTHYIYNKSDVKHESPLAQVETANGEVGFQLPELGKAYLEVMGGSIVYAYGGGNNATVTEETVIHVDNPGEVVNHILVNATTGEEGGNDVYEAYETNVANGADVLLPTGYTDLLNFNRFKEMGINTGISKPSSAEFQIGRFFGGNNHADMTIRPTWNLLNGKIRNLYSGGNQGRMLHDKGLLLDINNVKYIPVPSGKKLNKGLAYFTSNTGGGRFIAAGTEVSDGTNYYSTLTIDNVFGGCRMADVDPKVLPLVWDDAEDDYKSVKGIDGNIDGYKFPDNLAARVIVAAGDINNVYGGNDVRGRVHFGNAVGVHTSIRGDVYGGGNGAYAYTDNQKLENDNVYGDFYYDYGTGVEGLLNIRPDAEQVSVSLRGNDKDHPTIIGGSVYAGGNCATLRTEPKHADAETYPETALKGYPLTEVKIGSHVIAENVFLGNNGEDMVKFNEKSATELEGVLRTYARTDIPGAEGDRFNSMDLTNPDIFAAYMDGIALGEFPRVIEESTENNDRYDYEPYTSYIGSVFYGSNRGSVNYSGSLEINNPVRVTIYDKLVAGCNNANIAKTKYNARYEGGVLGSDAEVEGYTDGSGKIKDRIVMNLSGARIRPLRLNSTKTGLEWNTYNLDGEGKYVPEYLASTPQSGATLPAVTESPTVPASDREISRRLVGGNVYGGCYESGHVNGNVVINLKGSLHDRHDTFDAFEGEEDGDDILYEPPTGGYKITDRKSGVILNEQGMDVLGDALSIYGGGKGVETEIWGSATVNIESGYNFQIFGGSENGVIGKGVWQEGTLNDTGEIYEGGKYAYPETADPQYSTYVNLNSKEAGVSRAKDSSEDIADVEFIYGGGNNGLILGNTNVNLDNGRLFNLFAGSCNADILGHTETYVGLNGFPYLRDHIYGGNDLGGEIKGNADFSGHVRNYNANKTKIHGYDSSSDAVPAVLTANAYVEYRKGKMKNIYGGCYGVYDYDEEFTADKGYSSPKLNNSFVNFRPNSDENGQSHVDRIFGAGEGYSGFRDGDKMQNSSYVLVDIPFIKDPEEENLSENEYFTTTEVFGSGENNGMGMTAPPPADNPGDSGTDEAKEAYQAYQAYLANPDAYSAIVDLLGGQIRNVFGGSYNEGITRRTVVNVPEGSSIWMYSTESDTDPDETKHVKDYGNIFGGAYGTHVLPPCDVIESNVNYRSSNAVVNGSIFGGNNNERRTLRTKVNIFSPVWSHKDKEIKGYTAIVYGAGRGKDTWAEYTEVNLEDGANVYEVYGGGMMGHVLNAESVQKYMQSYQTGPSNEIAAKDLFWKDSDKWTINAQGQRIPTSAYEDKWKADWADAWTLGDYYSPVVLDGNGDVVDYDYTTYVNNKATNLSLVSPRAELDEVTASQLAGTKKYNANVIINEGATVSGYAYGGGYGKKAASLTDPNYLTGDIYGTTYIALLGGTVGKDIYAAGTAGSVLDLFGSKQFTASANAYIQGGTCRNVYGGGWMGNVGALKGDAGLPNDIPAETHVVLGKTGNDSFTNGDPAIQRNAYAGGEGGSIFGTANITLNNGHIGYVHLTARQKQNEKGEMVAADVSEGLAERYEDKIHDETYYEVDEDGFKVWKGKERLEDCGNVYGGGYDDVSGVDYANVVLYGGLVRNSVFGGGEMSIVGRGTKSSADAKPDITKAGKINVTLYNGHVLRNVYGGGKGYNTLGYGGSNSRYTDGYVFGQTRVNIHGGEIGTEQGVIGSTEIGKVGNVFGGGDAGLVYSAYELEDGTLAYGKKSGERYDDGDEGYYYKYEKHAGNTTEDKYDFLLDGTEKILTEDCKVLIEPWLQVTAADGISYDGKTYKKGDYIPTDYLNTLSKKNDDGTWPSDWNEVDVGSVVTGTDGKKIYTERGAIIHNGVFAGGNVPVVGTNQLSANSNTVFGNATASIRDVYHRDFITLGTGRVGGLYGDGNLTFVDGYRELNITDYGTDYYSIDQEITRDEYDELFPREQDYYEIRYKCQKQCFDIEGTEYHPQNDDKGINASTITADEMELLFLTDEKQSDGSTKKVSIWVDTTTGRVVAANSDKASPVLIYNTTKNKWEPNGTTFWKENGVCSRYAGRTMNTIQRSDFCGVFGSRLVMRGAKDRVTTIQDNTNYTINRVREVSLNLRKSDNTEDIERYPEGHVKEGEYKHPKAAEHGNYFGIYSVVNFLGALTSDVDFGDNGTGGWSEHGDIRKTDNRNEIYKVAVSSGTKPYGTATFYDWKKEFPKDNRRNNGLSHNQVALASGVYLELTTEKSTGKDLREKDWGLITGVVQLDLINVSTGVGGGFVYAKNIHGERVATGLNQLTLTSQNSGAVTKKSWKYIETDETLLTNEQLKFQTSGNFVHDTQTIIDDCYNIGSRYELDKDPVPAHYWFIKGSIYVYDQYISAYTGGSNAYSEKTEIPLTITAASNGRMTLMDVQPNLYAYYANSDMEKLGSEQKLVINDVTYHLNDPITYWDWSLLSASERKMFVEETYVNCVACKIDGTWYEAGKYVMSKADYETFKAQTTHTYKDINNHDVLDDEKHKATTEYVFRSSNNMSHDTGYILTYNVNNPSVWDKWYTLRADKNTAGEGQSPVYEKTTIPKKTYDGLTLAEQEKYWVGPTYAPDMRNLYGQREYKVSDIISQTTHTTYLTDYAKLSGDEKAALPQPQGEFERAYITKEGLVAYRKDPDDPTKEIEQNLMKGAKLAESEYSDTRWGELYDPDNSEASKVAPAYVCTGTIQISDNEFILPEELLTGEEKENYKTKLNKNIKTLLESKITGIESDKITTIQGMEAKDLDTYLTDEQKAALKYDGIKSLKDMLTAKEDIDTYVVEAYYCTTEGSYGGALYEKNNNYGGLDAWSSMSKEEREHFGFNYDALDLLIDPYYSKDTDGTIIHLAGEKYQYDGDPSTNPGVSTFDPLTASDEAKAKMTYSLEKSMEYTAKFTGTYKDDSGDEQTIPVEKYPKYRLDGTGTPTPVTVDKELTAVEYESIPNEKRHYAKINVTAENNEGTAGSPDYKVYVVNTVFVNREGSYAVGQTITKEEYDKMNSSDKRYISTVKFPSTGSYYYCRQKYFVNEHGEGETVQNASGVTATNYEGISVTETGIYTKDSENQVPIGFVIDEDAYKPLPNQQLGFSITGVSPTETSTLYVSRNSDIHDLSKEKIITVIYQYDYEESNESGSNITPYSERHVLNIHINFKSGIPTIGDIQEPGIVLPGTSITPKAPAVSPGAYEIIGSGWELFKVADEAETGSNGSDYNPATDPLYWYQDGYYISYYVKTYLGKTYSNHVPVRVANYHDLKQVMDDKKYHLHVDYDPKHLKRESKIYINDYSDGKDGLDYFKSFYDLSVLTGYTDENGDGLIDDGTFAGHKPLRSDVAAGNNLEFFLRTDIKHTDSWTPIGTAAGTCFEGTFHGDGHTISDLDKSLFNHLCGEVYNLGVTGRFTGAGVAETGSGYVENCWVKTTDTPVKKDPEDLTTHYAVFGNPSRSGSSGLKQVVNCYYPVSNNYDVPTTSTDLAHGKPIQMPDKAFYNGEVAYDLNGFYLYKRYNDNAQPGGTTTYKYWTPGEATPQVSSYAENEEFCSSGYNGIKYVEERYADGDFRYAAGIIPSSEDEHLYEEKEVDPDTGEETVKSIAFYPIWPDDYLFFGQMLTFGWAAEAHQDLPSAIVRDGGRLPQNSQNNRVYRAPAYYRNSTMNVAHFNPNAYLAQTKKGDASTKAYPHMTAIDFAGHYDTHEPNGASKPYVLGLSGNWFYPPLLDDDGLLSITNCDETQNLLVYAPSEDDNKKTYDVVNRYFKDPAYSDYHDATGTTLYTDSKVYNRVGKVPSLNVEEIHGHVVQNDTHLTATSDHLLVDKQDFDCPIPYTFNDDNLMWYQRVPDNYVGQLKDASGNYRNDTGWEGVSLPFTAELVTTNDKGEITHFYDGSETSKNGSQKIGHEYWLRELKKSSNMTEKSTGILEAEFLYPVISYGSSSLTDDSETMDKTVDNTFLWDYYYNADGKHTHKDKNTDEYQTYYGDSRPYIGYAMLTRGIPYIIGFPGERYYEFDLSGAFYATTTATPNPDKLDKQTITFASASGASIGKSDDEKVGVENSYLSTKYTFKPSYLNSEMKEYPTDPTGGVTYDVNYTLNKTGNSYDLVTQEASPVTTEAFRPFFAGSITAPSSGAKEYKGMTRSIVFNNGASELIYQEEEDDISNTGDLFIRAKKDKIVVSSTLTAETDVLIVNAAGALIDRYTIQPGETRETKVNASGVYIVNKKKIAVKIKD